jgi:hypothetical protein
VLIMDEEDFEENGNAPSRNLTRVQRKRGLTKIFRKKLVRIKRKKLKVLDVDTLSENDLLRVAILNGYFEEEEMKSDSNNTAAQIREKMTEYNSDSTINLRLILPKQFNNKSVDGYVVTIPYKNLLLWCTKCQNASEAALHLSLAVDGLDEVQPRTSMVDLIGRTCGETNCSGIYRIWTFNTTDG